MIDFIKSRLIDNDLKITTTIENVTATFDGEMATFAIPINYNTAYGFGEKYNQVNQFGQVVEVVVKEKCFNQGVYSYFTFPFMISAQGFGIYVKHLTPITFDLTSSNKIVIKYSKNNLNQLGDICLIKGTPAQIIKQFKQLTLPTKLFPKWVLGAWMSSNRWENEADIYQQLEELKKSKIPHNVIVIERWSDLTTFYNWNQSQSSLIKGDEYHNYKDFDFTNSVWRNPQQMVSDLHKQGLHLLLWELPVYATEESIEGENAAQRYIDNQYVIENKECVMTKAQTVYKIPKGNWFAGSMIPDFTNEECSKHWFNHRQHLLQIGVDGFKCDGGEFIYDDDCLFSNGMTGKEMKNHYAGIYLKAYHDYTDKIIFSRSGDEFTPAYALTWAGDQETTWPELNHIMKALLSASISGINYWGFDISGFSGQLPTKTLYLRSVQLAAFVPLMQWHSDPICNGGWDHSLAWKINDRSPWNLSQFHKDETLLVQVKKYFNFHYNLIPYFYNLSLEATINGVPAVRHLLYEFPDDENVQNIEDQFMVGNSLLVCPILEDYIDYKNVYLPEGIWYDLYTSEKYYGGRNISLRVEDAIIPVFIRENTAIVANLDKTLTFGSEVSNDLKQYQQLTFIVAGAGNYQFKDDVGNEINIEWDNNHHVIIKNKLLLDVAVVNISRGGKVWQKN